MRHLFLILAVLISGYFAWTVTDDAERAKALKLITKHGFRLGAIVFIPLALLFAATQLPSSSII